MKASFGIAALLLLSTTIAGTGAAQGTANAPTVTTYQLHKFKQAIGTETVRSVATGAGVTLTDSFTFTDRGSHVPLQATLQLAANGSPIHFVAKGKNSRLSRLDVAVDVAGASVTVRTDTTTAVEQASGPFFTISGYAPVMVQEQLIRYWEAHGKPATLRTFPSGSVHIVARGVDTVASAAGSAPVRRFEVEGVIWGRETLWMDRADRLVAVVTIDAEFDHFEAVRSDFESSLTTFIARAASDAAQSLAALASVHPDTGDFALVGGTLIDATGAGPVPNAVVVVRGGRIIAAGPRSTVRIPAGVRQIDITGKTVLPGLWDMHAHYEQVEWGPIYLAAGVTTVRDVGNEFDFISTVRTLLNTGRGLGPHMLLAGVIDGPGPYGLGVERASTPEEGEALVKRYHDAGFQQIKIYSSITRPTLDSICAAAHRLGMTVTGHIPFSLDAYGGVAAGMDQINHIQYIVPLMKTAGALPLDTASAPARKAIDFLVQHHTVLDPTLVIFEWADHPARIPFSDIEPGVAKVAPELRSQLMNTGVPAAAEASSASSFNDMVMAVSALHKAGVTIVAGTDQTVPGYSLHRELELYVEAGFTPMEAIQAATLVPAQVMHVDGDVGTVTVGKRADLIVVDGNPLVRIADLRNITMVIAGGRRYAPAPLWRSVGFTP
ncbi:MAG TPA: amidohydrolase family protein [Gemmatimonadales bacterium]|nr:amidohydrolase family protein [Gemmatimonadales bacterium]